MKLAIKFIHMIPVVCSTPSDRWAKCRERTDILKTERTTATK